MAEEQKTSANDSVTNVDAVVDRIDIIERTSKKGRPYKFIRIKLADDTEVNWYTFDEFSRWVVPKLEKLLSEEEKNTTSKT